MNLITTEQFSAVFPKANSATFVPILNNLLPKYFINTREGLCCFLAQCGYESNGFTEFDDGAHRAANSLLDDLRNELAVSEIAVSYYRNNAASANRCYADLFGNGSEESGDGYRFRRRGLLKIFGRQEYLQFSRFSRTPEIIETPDLIVQDKELLVLSSIWFWMTRRLNRLVNFGDFKLLTLKINRDLEGLEDRFRLYQELLNILSTENGDVPR